MTMDEKLMTVDEFNIAVKKWALKVKLESVGNLRSDTHSSGHLANNVTRFVDSMAANKPVYKIAYRFDLYGIYRRWGAGRGYKIKDFKVTVTRKHHGLFGDADEIRRFPLDWIDRHIDAHTGELVDLMCDYYRDVVIERIIGEITKAKIHKKQHG